MSNIINADSLGGSNIRGFDIKEINFERPKTPKNPRVQKPKDIKQDAVKENRDHFVIDIGASIKTDEDRIAEIEKERYSEFKRRLADIEKNSFEEGVKKGMTELLARANELGNMRREFYNILEKEMMGFVFAISKAVINAELVTNKEVVLGCIKAAIRSAFSHEAITIKVNQEDLKYVLSCKEEIESSVEGVGKDLKIEGSPSIKKGGCVIETDFGDIESDVELNFERIKNELGKL